MTNFINQSQYEIDEQIELRRVEFLNALGGSGRILKMVADDASDPLCEFLKREAVPQTSTIESYFTIKRENQNWLSSFKEKRLIRENDKRNLWAAIGEMRAYADLLQLPFVTVVPHASTQPGADF